MADTNDNPKDRTNEDEKSDSMLKDTGTENNEFVHTGDAERVNPNLENEVDKAKETSEQDYETFDIKKVDDLKETKKDDSSN